MAEPEAPATEEAAPGWNWVDTCGIIAGIVLVVILADVFTDGRVISRRLKGRPAQPQQADEVPVE